MALEQPDATRALRDRRCNLEMVKQQSIFTGANSSPLKKSLSTLTGCKTTNYVILSVKWMAHIIIFSTVAYIVLALIGSFTTPCYCVFADPS
jgi:hypothetical protein